MGCCEREVGRLGTLYNTLLFIDEDGNLVGRHRKLVPTLGERLVHARGDAEGLRAYPTSAGVNVSGLMCGENSNALATYALDAQGTNVHVASWPSHFQLGANISDIVQMVTRALAYQMKAFVINAVSVINEEMFRSLPVTEQHRTYLEQQGRGSSIIGPSGEFLGRSDGTRRGHPVRRRRSRRVGVSEGRARLRRTLQSVRSAEPVAHTHGAAFDRAHCVGP